MDYVLATSCTEPDQEYPNTQALARELERRRGAHPGPGLPFCVVPATMSRGPELPGGQVLAVRLGDARGHLLGYCFMPSAPAFALRSLREALVAASLERLRALAAAAETPEAA